MKVGFVASAPHSAQLSDLMEIFFHILWLEFCERTPLSNGLAPADITHHFWRFH